MYLSFTAGSISSPHGRGAVTCGSGPHLIFIAGPSDRFLVCIARPEHPVRATPSPGLQRAYAPRPRRSRGDTRILPVCRRRKAAEGKNVMSVKSPVNPKRRTAGVISSYESRATQLQCAAHRAQPRCTPGAAPLRRDVGLGSKAGPRWAEKLLLVTCHNAAQSGWSGRIV